MRSDDKFLALSDLMNLGGEYLHIHPLKRAVAIDLESVNFKGNAWKKRDPELTHVRMYLH